MSALPGRVNLADAPDFQFAGLRIAPSACRVFAGTEDVRIEAQTMSVLVLLARADGATVSRDALIEACWEGRIVSDDAISRTIAKVRAVARGITPEPFKVETLPKVGYRLIAAGVEAEAAPAIADLAPEKTAPAVEGVDLGASSGSRWGWRPVAAMVATVVAIPIVWAMIARQPETAPAEAYDLPLATEVVEAVFLLDRERLRGFLDRGWDPNWKVDTEGSAAIHALFMTCERNPAHDQRGVEEVAQQLVLAGANLSMRNKWGDSPLDIAISPRYCGPHHPVTDYLKSMSPAEVTKAAMVRACGEAFGGVPTKADWAGSGLTRAECKAAGALK